MKNEILKFLVHLILPTRNKLNLYLQKISKDHKVSEILEIGSGGEKRKKTTIDIFKDSKSFLQTDINEKYGHQILDLTNLGSWNKKFDFILCTNVLEHIFEIENAIFNFDLLLKSKGKILVSVPFIYPLHDEPEDYWRFTEHSLKKLFSNYEIIDFKQYGLRQFPTQYILYLQKKN